MTQKLDAIGVVVSDLERAVAFFRLLGVPFADPGESPHHEARLESGVRLMLDTEDLMKQMDPEWTAPTGNQRVGLAFHCGEPADVDATYQPVVAAGFSGVKAPWDAFWHQRYAQVADDDGNVVDLFAPLPE